MIFLRASRTSPRQQRPSPRPHLHDGACHPGPTPVALLVRKTLLPQATGTGTVRYPWCWCTRISCLASVQHFELQTARSSNKSLGCPSQSIQTLEPRTDAISRRDCFGHRTTGRTTTSRVAPRRPFLEQLPNCLSSHAPVPFARTARSSATTGISAQSPSAVPETTQLSSLNRKGWKSMATSGCRRTEEFVMMSNFDGGLLKRLSCLRVEMQGSVVEGNSDEDCDASGSGRSTQPATPLPTSISVLRVCSQTGSGSPVTAPDCQANQSFQSTLKTTAAETHEFDEVCEDPDEEHFKGYWISIAKQTASRKRNEASEDLGDDTGYRFADCFDNPMKRIRLRPRAFLTQRSLEVSSNHI